MAAANYNIIIDQHQDWSRGFQVKQDDVVVDLTGFTFEAQLRERTQSDTAYDFTVTVLDEAQGLINMSMSDALTSTIPAGDYVYDLVMTNATGGKSRLLQGQASVEAGVTR